MSAYHSVQMSNSMLKFDVKLPSLTENVLTTFLDLNFYTDLTLPNLT